MPQHCHHCVDADAGLTLENFVWMQKKGDKRKTSTGNELLRHLAGVHTQLLRQHYSDGNGIGLYNIPESI